MTATDAPDTLRVVEDTEYPPRSWPVSPTRFETLSRRALTVADRPPMDIASPYNAQPFASVPSSTEEDVEEAFRIARAAQPAWAARSFAERGRVLRRLAELVLERQVEILDIMQIETAKARAHAFEEVADTAIVANYYARTAEKHLSPKRREGALPVLTRTREVRAPKGVVGFIAPWNYPLSMGITDAIPALMAGNAAVIKPAALTPFTLLWVAELFDEAGLPEGLLQVVTGRGSVVGTAIIDRADFVTFTGSTDTGRTVATQCAERLIGCALELGGKNALLVLNDADVDEAVDIAIRGTFANSGQLCISFERIFVPATMLEEFSRKMVARVADMQLSTEIGWGGDMGSLISEDQLETVKGHVDDAVAKGVTVLTGGEPRGDAGPYYFAPTVLTDVTEDMTLFAEETFGPVVSLYGYDHEEEAVERINSSRYGLNAAVVSGSPRRGAMIGERLDAGTININEAYAAAWASVDAPMGGVKDSGLGRRHGADGIHKYTEPKNIAVQHLVPAARIPFLSEEQSAKALTAGLNLMFKVPGLRR